MATITTAAVAAAEARGGGRRERPLSGVMTHTCAGNKSTQTGARSILTATSTTFTRCLLHRFFLLPSHTGPVTLPPTTEDGHHPPVTVAPLTHSPILKEARPLPIPLHLTVTRLPRRLSVTATLPRAMTAPGHPTSLEKSMRTKTR